MRIPVPSRYLTLPASALVLALTGCASDGYGDGSAATSPPQATSPLKLIKAAYTTTTAAKSARTFMSITDSEADSGDNSVSGVDDFEHQSSEWMYSSGATGTVDQREIGSDSYIHYVDPPPGMPGFLGATKPWAHLHLANNNNMPAGLSTVMGGPGPDPAAFIRLLTGTTSYVTALGTEIVRGQPSTHYRMTFDEAKIRKLDAQMHGCDEGGPTAGSPTPVDVWLDGQGRLTRMQTRFVDSGPAGLPSGFPTASPPPTPAVIVMTIEFYDYGVPASIQPPPSDETQTINIPHESSSTANSCTSPGEQTSHP